MAQLLRGRESAPPTDGPEAGESAPVEEVAQILDQIRQPCARAATSLSRGDASGAEAALREISERIKRAPRHGIRSCMRETVLPAKLAIERHYYGPSASERSHVQLTTTAMEAALNVYVASIERAGCEFVPTDIGLQALQLGSLVAAKSQFDSEETLREVSLLAIMSGGKSAGNSLADEDYAPILGHALSSSLQVARVEGDRATRGSKRVRKQSLTALRALVETADDADALAFFLPGIASGLMNSLSGSHPGRGGHTTAGAGSSATAEGIRALSALLIRVLADDRNVHLLSVSDTESPSRTSESARERLQEIVADVSDGSSEKRAEVERSREDEASSSRVDMKNRMRVVRDEEWRKGVAEKLDGMCERAMRPLVNHPHVRVRSALATANGEVCRNCWRTLPEVCRALFQDLLAARDDEFPAVSEAAKAQLALLRNSGRLRSEVKRAVTEEVEKIPAEAKKADKSELVASCKRISSGLGESEESSVCLGHVDFHWLWSQLACPFEPPPLSGPSTSNDRGKGLKSSLPADEDLLKPVPGLQGSGDDHNNNQPCLPECDPRRGRLETEDAAEALSAACRAIGERASSEGNLGVLTAELASGLAHLRRSGAEGWRRRATGLLRAASEVAIGSSGGPEEWAQVTAELTRSRILWGCHNVPAADVEWVEAASEFCGSVARALGGDFSTRGELLPSVLPKLLGKLGDGNSSVASASAKALMEIGRATGCGASLRGVVCAHSDYVIDALCLQLRDPVAHPGAPHLLAATLRRAGAAQELLPLLAEPLDRAKAELSAPQKQRDPQRAGAYLAALVEVAEAARHEAENGAEVTRKSHLSPSEIRRVEVAAQAAGRVARACAGAARDGTLRHRVRALKATGSALKALRAAADAGGAEEFGKPPRRVADKPPNFSGWGLGSYNASTPDAAQRERAELMPAVAAAWPTVITALREGHPGGFETSCELLRDVCEASSGWFVARRFEEEALPLLLSILERGLLDSGNRGEEHWRVAQTKRVQITLPGGKGRRSSDRARASVMRAIADVARSKPGREALSGCVHRLAESMPRFLGDAEDGEVRRAAADCLSALHGVDPDLVHVALSEAAFVRAGPEADHLRPRAPSPNLPSHRCLAPPGPGELPRGAGRGAAKLLNLLEDMPGCRCQPSWSPGSGGTDEGGETAS